MDSYANIPILNLMYRLQLFAEEVFNFLKEILRLNPVTFAI